MNSTGSRLYIHHPFLHAIMCSTWQEIRHRQAQGKKEHSAADRLENESGRSVCS